ncbi:MAG: polysaccharide deacetylase family protein [Betaproteobacteria bacterium]|nr:polysaccharide deacetylase family protein [Betaproteobacteria bacterium]
MRSFHRVKAAVVATAAWVLYATGILYLLVARRLKDRAVVLMYHRVIAPDEMAATFSHPGIVVAAETFDEHLRLLRRYFHVLSIEEFASRMRNGGTMPSRSCLITFDDGWSDNYSRAFPLLRKHGLSAVVFLPVDYIGSGKRFWQETLTRALLRAVRNGGSPSCRRLLEQVGLHEPYPKPDDQGKLQLREMVGRLKQASPAMRDEIIRQASAVLAEIEDTVGDVDTFLSWEQVREMAAGGIAFGSHAASHELLNRLPIDAVREEVASSKRDIEAMLGRPVIAFSYPNGDHDATTCRAVAAEGYHVAFTTESGTVGHGDDCLRLRRVNVHQGAASSGPLLMARIAGVL